MERRGRWGGGDVAGRRRRGLERGKRDGDGGRVRRGRADVAVRCDVARRPPECVVSGAVRVFACLRRPCLPASLCLSPEGPQWAAETGGSETSC
ncbi:Hypothetical predicted protein [Podarcis lilfordi]|uniref:Uncharacterized protein n=1 Tax=Podarcis lilfordi TaxID=74358 RepID=A0AA35KNT4_9SAUR|nr:Hypothetical predicted protein [Podarcis lilfordi]